jgi:hypothetical protein
MNMHRSLLFLLAVTVMSVSSFAFSADPPPSKPTTTPPSDKKTPTTPMLKEPIKTPGLPSPVPKPGVLPRAGCPDPAVTLRVGWPGRNADGTYTFRLLASIVNQGSAPFHSQRRQTHITLSEGPRVLLSEVWASPALNTVDLAPGAGISAVALVANWNPRSEFLADFTAQISYDPDIRMDSNPQNDDCNAANNIARLSVTEVRRVLEALPR